jgi:hypothetical protein
MHLVLVVLPVQRALGLVLVAADVVDDAFFFVAGVVAVGDR